MTIRHASLFLPVIVFALVLLPIAIGLVPHTSPETAGRSPPILLAPIFASLAVAVAAALLAVVIGGAVAAIVSLSDIPGRHLWASAMLIPFLCPGTVWAMDREK